MSAAPPIYVTGDLPLVTRGRILDLSTVEGRYRTLYLDPPWRYNDSTCAGAAAKSYGTMALEDIARLPIPSLLHPDGGHVWMWTTWPKLREGAPHRLLEAWDLEWVGEVVWHKVRLGPGRWLRPATEVLILAVRSGSSPPAVEKPHAFIGEPRTKHSVKPRVAYELIERYSPGPRLELFARGARAGWERWGNEA